MDDDVNGWEIQVCYDSRVFAVPEHDYSMDGLDDVARDEVSSRKNDVNVGDDEKSQEDVPNQQNECSVSVVRSVPVRMSHSYELPSIVRLNLSHRLSRNLPNFDCCVAVKEFVSDFVNDRGRR